MKNLIYLLLYASLITFIGCVRQYELTSPDQPDTDKPVLADRYPSTPEEIALVEHLASVTDVLKVLYKDNANVKLVNASIYARVFADETVLLGDLIFPAQSRLPQYSSFDSLSRAWQVDLSSFARQFWNEVRKRQDGDLEQFLQTLMPSTSSGQFMPDNGAAPAVSIYFPYSEMFSTSSGGTYLPSVSLLSASADTDEAPGSEPVYQGGTLTGYTTVMVNDVYTTSHPTHIVGVNGPVEPVAGPGGGGGGIGIGVICSRCFTLPPPTIVPVELKRSVLIEDYVLKQQYDNLISFSGNGGGSEVRLNRISAYMRPASGSAISTFEPLMGLVDENFTTHTRQDISLRVWKGIRTHYSLNFYYESRWDTSWFSDNHQQALAVWEYDNTNQRSTFNGQLNTTLLQTSTSPVSFVSGSKPYSIQVSSMHPPIKHLPILRADYFGQARNDFGFGVRWRDGNGGCVHSHSQNRWECLWWNDFAYLNPSNFIIPQAPAGGWPSAWPARDVGYQNASIGGVFGWVWPYRIYYRNGGPENTPQNQ